MGGQMGYNSLGNIVLLRRWACTSAPSCRSAWYYDVAEYTAANRARSRSTTPSSSITWVSRWAWFLAAILVRCCWPSSSAGSCSACAVRTSRLAPWASRSRRPNSRAHGVGSAAAAEFRCRYIPASPGDAGAVLLRRLHPGHDPVFSSFCDGSTAPASAWRSTRSATTRTRPRRWASIRPLQDRGLVDLGVLSWGLSGALFRQHDRLHRTAGGRLSDRHLRHFHGRDDLLGGKGTLWGPVIGAVAVPYHQGGHLDLSARLAVDRARRADHRQRRVLPAGHPGLAAIKRPEWFGIDVDRQPDKVAPGGRA